MRGLPLRRLAAAAAVLAAALVVAAPLGAAGSNSYTVKVLASDVPTPGATLDSDLVNGWGLVAGPHATRAEGRPSRRPVSLSPLWCRGRS